MVKGRKEREREERGFEHLQIQCLFSVESALARSAMGTHILLRANRGASQNTFGRVAAT